MCAEKSVERSGGAAVSHSRFDSFSAAQVSCRTVPVEILSGGVGLDGGLEPPAEGTGGSLDPLDLLPNDLDAGVGDTGDNADAFDVHLDHPDPLAKGSGSR